MSGATKRKPVQRLKRLEEVIGFTPEGGIVIAGNEDPSDKQICQELRKYARQFVNTAKVKDDTTFKLNRPHPKIGATKDTTMTKGEWMKEFNMDEQMFQAIKGAGYFVMLR